MKGSLNEKEITLKININPDSNKISFRIESNLDGKGFIVYQKESALEKIEGLTNEAVNQIIDKIKNRKKT
jgi:hypothetical protein